MTYNRATAVALCALMVGIAGAPGWYYTLLRVVVCGAAVVAVVATWPLGEPFWPLAFGALAALFNPISPVYLHSREAWIVIDAIAAALFVAGLWMLRRVERRDSSGDEAGGQTKARE